MVDGTPALLSTARGAGGGVFLVRTVSQGVGSCFQEVLHCRRGGAGFPSSGRTHRGLCHPLCSQSPAKLAARDGQQNARGWKSGSAGLSVSGAFGNASCHRFAL